MARENSYQAVILKKQAFGEGDEILTVFTEETGKLRLMGKSTKFSKSKLQYSLQTLFFVKLTTAARGSIPRVIGAEIIEGFAHIRENLTAVKEAFYVLELILKFTPDEQKNEALFNLLIKVLHFLNSAKSHAEFQWGLAKFKIEFLETLGLGIRYNIALAQSISLGFSNGHGSFTEEDTVDFVFIKPETFQQFLQVKKISFEEIKTLPEADLSQLQDILSGFLSYQLERDIKSERFLKEE